MTLKPWIIEKIKEEEERKKKEKKQERPRIYIEEPPEEKPDVEKGMDHRNLQLLWTEIS